MFSNFCYQLILSIKTSSYVGNRRNLKSIHSDSTDANASYSFSEKFMRTRNRRGLNQNSELNNNQCSESTYIRFQRVYVPFNSISPGNYVRHQSTFKNMSYQMAESEISNNNTESHISSFSHRNFEDNILPFESNGDMMFRNVSCIQYDHNIKLRERDNKLLFEGYCQKNISKPLGKDVTSKCTQPTSTIKSATPQITVIPKSQLNNHRQLDDISQVRKTSTKCTRPSFLKRIKLFKEHRKFVKFEKKYREILRKTEISTQEIEIEKNIQFYDKINDQIINYVEIENMFSPERTRKYIHRKKMRPIISESIYLKIRKLHKQTLRNIKTCEEEIAYIRDYQSKAKKYESRRNTDEMNFYSISLMKKISEYERFKKRYQLLILILTKIIGKVETYKRKIF